MVAAFRKRDGASRSSVLLLEAFLVASAVVTAGVSARVVHTHSLEDDESRLEPGLAWVPWCLRFTLYDRARRDPGAGPLIALGALWLLFLPNAPYIVTD